MFTTDDRWTCITADNADDGERATPVDVVGPFGCDPWGHPLDCRDVSAPPAYLRREFEIGGQVKRATVYLAALGWADLTINGRRVNGDYFTSGWTDYQKRVYYRAYDVTAHVDQGQNAWGVVLADGWYSGHIARYSRLSECS